MLLARPDVLEAEDQLRADNLNIGAARAAFFPSIELTGDGGLTSLALSTLFKGVVGHLDLRPERSARRCSTPAPTAAISRPPRRSATIGVATYEKTIQTAFREVADALAERGTIDEQLAAQQALANAAAASPAHLHAPATSAARHLPERPDRPADLLRRAPDPGHDQLAKQTNLVTLYAALGGGLDTPRPTGA